MQNRREFLKEMALAAGAAELRELPAQRGNRMGCPGAQNKKIDEPQNLVYRNI